MHSLPRELVSPVERDVLLVRARLTKDHEYLSWISNGRLAKEARTTRLYVIECNRSLAKKKLIVRAPIPRFKTETVQYFLAVNISDLDSFASMCQHTKPHQNQGFPLVCASTPYPDLTKKDKTKGYAVASATSAHTSFEMPFPDQKSSLCHPSPTEKRAAGIRTKTTSVGSFAHLRKDTYTPDDVFNLFWDAFPRSWKKRHRAKVREHFLRLGVGMAWFTKRWVPALQHVNFHEDGREREVRFQTSPSHFLTGKRWQDEF